MKLNKAATFHNIRKYHDLLTKMSTVRNSDLDSDIHFFAE